MATQEERFDGLLQEFKNNGFTEQQAIFLITLLNNFIPLI